MRLSSIPRLLGAGMLFLSAQMLSSPAAEAQPATDIMGAIRGRGMLICGVSPSTAGFALPDSQGVWRGLDVDICRAIASALLGDASRVRNVPTSVQQRFTALQSGEVDVLARNTTWTLGREASLGLAFAGISFYDGTGFMVKAASGVTSSRGLDGATVCVSPGSTTELGVADYFRQTGMRFSPLLIEDIEAMRGAFIAGRCDAYATDVSSLAAFRYAQGANGTAWRILPEVISKEPLGPAIRKGDWKFFDLVRWTLYALLTAEELGVTSQNIDQMMDSTVPEVQRLLGRTGGLGTALGVDDAWAARMIRQVGNYAEMWERNIVPIGIERGPNRLWSQGGLHYAPPMR
ncbi:amino acid ABC transporter substrate-binding protein (PAAT family) [Humitalea rosea]|uniref:Amino acid ABC transporter substrate-binding protein (PAAT family) n=1 Tax=Humitalea rosea TaxID=990373 RepID=A0A2W7HZQ0_9PROT|nr:amino acid ABC transporter substrate-binding protein [Humitalea rosea]PZW40016.1 amino acid ABC transporter substrate-binding protein (PAAT family) [Humitalea rosea]